VAKDPNIARVEVLKKLTQTWGLDPTTTVVTELPKPEPEPPKISFAVKAEDLNPTLPQFPFVVDVLRQGGLKFSIETTQLAQMQAQALGMVGRSPVTAEQEKTSTPDPTDPMGGTIETLSGPSQVPTAGVGPDQSQPPQQAQHGGAANPAERVDQHSLDITGNLPGLGAGTGAVM